MVLASAKAGQTNQAFDARAGSPPVAASSPKPPASCSHVVAAGDTLGAISSARLGTATRWKEITELNPGLKPTALRPGQVLKLPCSVGDGAGEGGAGTPPARAAFLDLLRGALSGPDAADGETAKASDAGAAPSGDSAAGKAAAPEEDQPLPPPPVWTAAQGEFLADVLTRWGTKAGWDVWIDTTDAWRLQVAFRMEGAFDAVVGELIRGMGHDGVPPMVRLFPNQVLRLGGPL